MEPVYASFAKLITRRSVVHAYITTPLNQAGYAQDSDDLRPIVGWS